jgi:ribosomal protein S18 acetylase RimI-like enzyme
MGPFYRVSDRMGMLIRALRPEDLDHVRETVIACGNFNDEEIRVAIEMADTPEDYSAFGAELDGKVRGFLCVGKTALTVSTWYLYWIAVHPEQQGTAMARDLQLYAEQFIRERGGERVVLETSGRADYARTRRFYEKAGYDLIGQIPDFYKPGDDCVIFCKKI